MASPSGSSLPAGSLGPHSTAPTLRRIPLGAFCPRDFDPRPSLPRSSSDAAIPSRATVLSSPAASRRRGLALGAPPSRSHSPSVEHAQLTRGSSDWTLPGGGSDSARDLTWIRRRRRAGWAAAGGAALGRDSSPGSYGDGEGKVGPGDEVEGSDWRRGEGEGEGRGNGGAEFGSEARGKGEGGGSGGAESGNKSGARGDGVMADSGSDRRDQGASGSGNSGHEDGVAAEKEHLEQSTGETVGDSIRESAPEGQQETATSSGGEGRLEDDSSSLSATSGMEAAPGQGSPKTEGDDAGEDLLGQLGDWREFRARLVRTGGIPLATGPLTGTESALAESAPAGSGSSGSSLNSSTPDASADVSGIEPGTGSAISEAAAASSAPFEPGEGGAASTGSPSRGPAVAPAPPIARRSGSQASVSATWAHPLLSPEQGCLVVAHPDAFGVSQQYFNQAVIFLFTHGAEGSAGVILNRPSQYTLGQVSGLEEFLPEFGAAPLYLGGDVGPTTMLCIHGIEELSSRAGALPICSGIFLGGAQGAKEHLRTGRSNSMDYRWFTRYAGWAPGQLEREVQAGYWFLAASSPDIVLKHCLALEKPLWREVMELMGGEYELLSKKTYGEA